MEAMLLKVKELQDSLGVALSRGDQAEAIRLRAEVDSTLAEVDKQMAN